MCRALAEALTVRADAVLTRAPTHRQQRNRAFAAEFLAPAEALRQRVPHRIVHEDAVAELAETFCVSTVVIERQLENHRIAQVA